MAGPDGVGFRGTVLDIPEKRMMTVVGEDGKPTTVPLADYLLEHHFARPFDAVLDRKAHHGLFKPER
jgi:hypothetical protein